MGAVGHLLTATEPTVAVPFGMARLAPAPVPGAEPYFAGRLRGLAAGPLTLLPLPEGAPADLDSSAVDHDFERSAPFAYAVLLEDLGIWAEGTATQHALHLRFTGGRCGALKIRFPAQAELRAPGGDTFEGSVAFGGARCCFFALLSAPYGRCEPLRGENGALVRLAKPAEELQIKLGLSYIGVAQARENLMREDPAWEYEAIREKNRGMWNAELGKIAVEGGGREERRTFYTCLYRSLLHMSCMSENGRYYSGFDHAVHSDGGRPFYNDDNIWDTYRTMHPLQLLLEPERQADMIDSYLRMYRQCGFLPQFPWSGGDRPVMTGNHAAAMIVDAYGKGCRDFDAETAFEAVRHNALQFTMLPWVNGPPTELDAFYREHGYFPALRPGERETVPEVHPFERRQAVSVTLEHAYDDWCVAVLAKALGREEDARLFSARAQNYRNVFDRRIGFMAPRAADGGWVEPFDPKRGGGAGGRDYFTECNAWIYTFHVQHDPAGLIGLLGGKAAFERKLDALFSEPCGAPKYEFYAQFPDMTGLMGQYCQGNEPAFHIPYLYNRAGAPWKTQRLVREIMKTWYNPGPFGLCGDEDAGALSAWYVFSAMGFYPTCPGRPEYDLGSPLFEHILLRAGEGTVRIEAEGASENKYIQSAELGDRPLCEPWVRHGELLEGGPLVLRMGPRPNPAWGAGER